MHHRQWSISSNEGPSFAHSRGDSSRQCNEKSLHHHDCEWNGRGKRRRNSPHRILGHLHLREAGRQFSSGIVLGTAVRDNGVFLFLEGKAQPLLTKHGVTIECRSENRVPVVASTRLKVTLRTLREARLVATFFGKTRRVPEG